MTHDLDRFVHAQADSYDTALAELRADWSATLPAVLGPTFVGSALR